MINIDLSHLSQIILDGIFDQELDKQIRATILDTVSDKQYDIACEVFHKARQVYFDLGFIDNSYTEKKDIQARIDAVGNENYKHYDISSIVFDATRIAYFDLGFELRRLLRGN